jgi:hypothetical protein
MGSQSNSDYSNEIKPADEVAADQEKRRDLLAYVLANAPREPRRMGIFGMETCQWCGEIGNFSGQWGAVGSHSYWGRRHQELRPLDPPAFIAGRHPCHKEIPVQPERRFCETCRSMVLLGDAEKIAHHFLCRSCVSAFTRHAPRARWASMLLRFTRFRWRYHGLIEEEPWPFTRYGY